MVKLFRSVVDLDNGQDLAHTQKETGYMHCMESVRYGSYAGCDSLEKLVEREDDIASAQEYFK